MNWFKKISEILEIYETIDKTDPRLYFEAIKLKDGRIIYDRVFNHWALYYRYHNIIGKIDNIESLGQLSGDGIYTASKYGQEVEEYLNPSKYK